MWREKPDGQPLPDHPLRGRAQYGTHGGSRTTHHGPLPRGPGGRFSSRLRQAPRAARCDRLERFLRPGLGPGFAQTAYAPSVSARLSRHAECGNRLPPRLPEFMGGALVLVSDQHGIRITLHRYILLAGVTAARLIGHLVVQIGLDLGQGHLVIAVAIAFPVRGTS